MAPLTARELVGVRHVRAVDVELRAQDDAVELRSSRARSVGILRHITLHHEEDTFDGRWSCVSRERFEAPVRAEAHSPIAMAYESLHVMLTVVSSSTITA